MDKLSSDEVYTILENLPYQDFIKTVISLCTNEKRMLNLTEKRLREYEDYVANYSVAEIIIKFYHPNKKVLLSRGNHAILFDTLRYVDEFGHGSLENSMIYNFFGSAGRIA